MKISKYFQRQIDEKACTICKHAFRAPQWFCDDCGDNAKHWELMPEWGELATKSEYRKNFKEIYNARKRM